MGRLSSQVFGALLLETGCQPVLSLIRGQNHQFLFKGKEAQALEKEEKSLF